MTGKPLHQGSAPFVSSDVPDAEFDQLRHLLLRRRRLDLGMYKNPCIRRRLAKRVRALGLPDIAAYLGVLRGDEGEIDALVAALTIHVSHFFRNPSTFAALERTIVPDLIDRARSLGRDGLRIWSAGCAGGEEPYSLGLLVDEMGAASRVKILGTDLSPEVLADAREGLYEAARLLEVPNPVRERYFRAEGEKFRLDRRIRGMVDFDRHDLLSAGEFPAADLILCRNVLIYFSVAEQERILGRFAACLGAGGALVLGKTETLPGTIRRLFGTENMAERIYRRH